MGGAHGRSFQLPSRRGHHWVARSATARSAQARRPMLRIAQGCRPGDKLYPPAPLPKAGYISKSRHLCSTCQQPNCSCDITREQYSGTVALNSQCCSAGMQEHALRTARVAQVTAKVAQSRKLPARLTSLLQALEGIRNAAQRQQNPVLHQQPSTIEFLDLQLPSDRLTGYEFVTPFADHAPSDHTLPYATPAVPSETPVLVCRLRQKTSAALS